MADEKLKAEDSAAKRKKITIAIIVVLVAFLGWQVYGMFGGGSDVPIPPPNSKVTAKLEELKKQREGNNGQSQGAAVGPQSQNNVPEPQNMGPQVARQLPMSEREMELLKLQQETEARYIAATNQLQMLKLTLEIAETNKNIMAAKLETITKEKGIVDLLTPPKKVVETNYNEQLVGGPQTPPVQSAPAQKPAAHVAVAPPPLTTTPQEEEPLVPYTVLSVSKIQDRWNAVVGVQGALYSIHIGDIVPVDGSKVVAISSGGIMLEKDGKERKISLVPII